MEYFFGYSVIIAQPYAGAVLTTAAGCSIQKKKPSFLSRNDGFKIATSITKRM
jgi:hypothetical protein